jgi:hypothetical protein
MFQIPHAVDRNDSQIMHAKASIHHAAPKHFSRKEVADLIVIVKSATHVSTRVAAVITEVLIKKDKGSSGNFSVSSQESVN